MPLALAVWDRDQVRRPFGRPSARPGPAVTAGHGHGHGLTPEAGVLAAESPAPGSESALRPWSAAGAAGGTKAQAGRALRQERRSWRT
jgi:hypothetical protein